MEDHYKKPILYDDENNAIIQIKNRKGEIDNVIVDADRWHELTLYKWAENYGYYSNRQLGRMHRYIKGVPIKNNIFIDHIDTNRKNNKACNLRPVDASLSSHNRTKQKGKYSSDFFGVCKDRNLYIAMINRKRIGSYETEIEAAKAYDAEARKIYGSDARTNFKNEVEVPPDPDTPSTSA